MLTCALMAHVIDVKELNMEILSWKLWVYFIETWNLFFLNKYLLSMESLTCTLSAHVSMTLILLLVTTTFNHLINMGILCYTQFLTIKFNIINHFLKKCAWPKKALKNYNETEVVPCKGFINFSLIVVWWPLSHT